MKIPTAVHAFMQKPMDRKDFLKHLAVGALMISGGGILFQSLGGADKLGLGGAQASQSAGYGGSTYGGS